MFALIFAHFCLDFCTNLKALLSKTLGTFAQISRHFYRTPLALSFQAADGGGKDSKSLQQKQSRSARIDYR